jgi:hypothetical protein
MFSNRIENNAKSTSQTLHYAVKKEPHSERQLGLGVTYRLFTVHKITGCHATQHDHGYSAIFCATYLVSSTLSSYRIAQDVNEAKSGISYIHVARLVLPHLPIK